MAAPTSKSPWLGTVWDHRWQLAPLVVLALAGWFGPSFFLRFVGFGASTALFVGVSASGTILVAYGLVRFWPRLEPHTRALWGICLVELGAFLLWASITAISAAIYTFRPYELVPGEWLQVMTLVLASLTVGWIAARFTRLGLGSVAFVIAAYVTLQVTASPSAWEWAFGPDQASIEARLLPWMAVQVAAWTVLAVMTKRFSEANPDARSKGLALLAAVPLSVAIGKGVVAALSGFVLVPIWPLLVNEWLPRWSVHPLEAVGLALLAAAGWKLFEAWQPRLTRAT